MITKNTLRSLRGKTVLPRLLFIVASLLVAGYGCSELVQAGAVQTSRGASRNLSRQEALRQIKASHMAQNDDSTIEFVPVNELWVEPPGSPLASRYPKTAVLGSAGLLQVELAQPNRQRGNMRYYDVFKATITEKLQPFVIRISGMACREDECAQVVVATFSGIEIIGVGEPAPQAGRVVSVVDYQVLTSPNEVGKALGLGPMASKAKEARFVRYDDGWRLVERPQ